MAEPLTARQRACLVSVANSDTLGLSLQQACRAALDRIDHLEAANADLYAACKAIEAWDDDAENLPCGRFVTRLSAAVEAVLAALAKARGEVSGG